MNIFVTEQENMGVSVKQKLEELGKVKYGYSSESEFKEFLRTANILFVRLGRMIDDSILCLAPNLKYILSATTALNHIDIESLKKREIRLFSLRDCMADIEDIAATAEHTWALLLSLVRNIPQAVSKVSSKQWSRIGLWGTELKGQNLGILGYGRLGRKVAKFAKSFGMNIFICETDHSKIEEDYISVPIEDLFSKCNIISIHVTSSVENTKLVSYELIEKMPPGSIIINTSRGHIVDSLALVKGLRSGKLKGVAVDVLQNEEKGDFPNDPLYDCMIEGFNVIITPHIGGATLESIEKAEMAVLNQFIKICNQKEETY